MSGRLSSDHSRSFSQSSQSLPQRHSQGPDSDSMHHRSPSGRSSNVNVFSDEYSLEPIDSEQSTLTPRSLSISSSISSHTLRSAALPPQKTYNTVPIDPPDVTENPFGDDARVSFDDTPHRSSLPQKGELDFSTRDSTASNNTDASVAQRSQSTSSRFSLPTRAMSPYTGATGPSHPYAMYPQVGVSRSPSIATTSTVRPMERPLGDSNAPQHPYAMYSQAVVPEEGLDTPIHNPVIPLGFPGHEQAYQRPPGRADDDVGDLIGPDGHTEQLPPYSRYPDGVLPKEEETMDSEVGAGIITEEIAHSTSREPPVSETSSRTLVVAGNAGNSVNGNGNPPEEHEEPPATGVMAFEEKLKSKGKKRVCCGLPIWTLVLISIVIFVVACIAGVIGGVLGAKKAASEERSKPKGPDIVTVTATPRADATPISSMPANVSPVPTGEFLIPASPKNQSKFCIAESGYTASWGCMGRSKIPILLQGEDGHRHNITFEQRPLSSSFSYGAQAPILPQTQQLTPAYDSGDMALGPALTFFTLFDKLVIVPQGTFSSNDASKRSVSERDVMAESFHRKQAVQAGDRPWFCWWNGTMMEFFLYTNQTSKHARQSSTASSAATETPPPQNGKRGLTPLDSLFDYPRRIKIEEKRNHPGSRAPYCQQMQVLDDGSIATASPETIEIKEVQPTPTTTLKGYGSATQTYTAKAQYESVCYCASLTD
ncbi:hypothetical protein ALT_1741 [Aspergillus lentulus]|uniref:DUF7820 domain-containing protein n=1 Tax=Aspergillus lentulus TaxID=293939 RepID=A0AAN4PGV8_ASPLE|nr:hypothetical protein CNMCM6069_004433 [Aspergillus lentulus]KAF4158837.1 hypothetical protein CNMCM6936_004749 [Aspergillus lentulus]KAF4174321.1 hypothetical protein CNMCM8060_008810 [Aspergillus lentulus]KAF4182838.1 hypothetical protein CNMCM7927_009464 [Aspergillus lentulus]KAF4192712.1 hypothetical protein CNMCM8694_000046 [Aspergillus lentulus]